MRCKCLAATVRRHVSFHRKVREFLLITLSLVHVGCVLFPTSRPQRGCTAPALIAGFNCEYPVEKLMRDCKIFQVQFAPTLPLFSLFLLFHSIGCPCFPVPLSLARLCLSHGALLRPVCPSLSCLSLAHFFALPLAHPDAPSLVGQLISDLRGHIADPAPHHRPGPSSSCCHAYWQELATRFADA